MLKVVFSRLAVAAVVGVGVVAAAGAAKADPKDYRFEAVQAHVKAATDTVVQVRLVHVPDNKPVEGAIIFSSKMIMPMPGMADMTTKVAAQKPTTPGIYPFQSDLSEGGMWKLALSAKVQGEAGTITGEVPFMAMK